MRTREKERKIVGESELRQKFKKTNLPGISSLNLNFDRSCEIPKIIRSVRNILRKRESKKLPVFLWLNLNFALSQKVQSLTGILPLNLRNAIQDLPAFFVSGIGTTCTALYISVSRHRYLRFMPKNKIRESFPRPRNYTFFPYSLFCRPARTGVVGLCFYVSE
jgi:hypothetical protein